MPLLKPTIIIFDMDGTTVRHINPKLLNILEKIDDIMYRFGDRGEIDYRVDHKGDKRPKLLVHRALHKFRRKPVEQIVEPYLGIREILQYIKSLNLPVAIVSNGLGRGYGFDILEKFDLAQFFDAKIFREDFSEAKPNPEPLLNALTAMNIILKPQDVVWCIGDRRKDIEAALNLEKVTGAKVEPLSFGMEAAICILKNKISTDHIITSYSELQLKLKDLFKS